MMAKRRLFLGYAAALGSAALVGLFTVVNKWLLVGNMPALTAGAWTYGAAGVALIPWAFRRGGLRLRRPGITALWLLAGSVLGPSLYFLGLSLTSGVQGVLMINLEAVFTSLLAFLLFRERLSGSALTAGAMIVAGGIWLSWPAGGGGILVGNALGNLLIACGYMGWALENNLGRVLGEDTPAVTLVCVKALAAAVVMALLALVFKQPLAIERQAVPGVLVSGAVALALSLALFYWAMGRIGTGRAGLISSTSSLWGVLAALTLLGESLSAQVLTGGLLMALGLGLFAWDTKRQPETAAAHEQVRVEKTGWVLPPLGRR